MKHTFTQNTTRIFCWIALFVKSVSSLAAETAALGGDTEDDMTGTRGPRVEERFSTVFTWLVFVFLLSVTQLDAQTLNFRDFSGLDLALENWLYVDSEVRNKDLKDLTDLSSHRAAVQNEY